MQPFPYHLFVCEQQKPEGLPCCSARGSRDVIEALRKEIGARGLQNTVQITPCGSLGLCERGPNMVVYPDAVWYSGVTPADVPEIVESHFVNGRPVARLANTDEGGARTEICGNRDRYLASVRAKDAAGVLPDDLNQTIRGFMESRVILTALELDLFSAIGRGADAAEIATRCGTDPRATEMLVNALASLGLVAKSAGMYHNTPATARYFVEGSPDNHRLALMHTARLWRRWSTLTEAVRSGHPLPDTDPDNMRTEAFIEAMHRNAAGRASQVAQAVPVSGPARMLDIGGGSGAYAIAFARANPQLSADILDRPEVLPIAAQHIAEAGVGERVKVRAGDLRTGSLGSGYDIALLSAICHMLSEDENRDLFRRCREALSPGGRLVVQDFLLSADKTGPRTGALFALNMLVNTAGGSSYSEAEYTDWLRAAGFTSVERARMPGPTGVLVAR